MPFLSKDGMTPKNLGKGESALIKCNDSERIILKTLRVARRAGRIEIDDARVDAADCLNA